MFIFFLNNRSRQMTHTDAELCQLSQGYAGDADGRSWCVVCDAKTTGFLRVARVGIVALIVGVCAGYVRGLV